MADRKDEVVIWYRPRVRVWLDKEGQLHLGGEPDGLTRVVGAFRSVARGVQERVDVQLRADRIPKDRNPVPKLGIVQMFEILSFSRDLRATDIRAESDGSQLSMFISPRVQATLGYALMEALDGEGDFSVAVTFNNKPSRLWFWGYSNPHAVNGF